MCRNVTHSKIRNKAKDGLLTLDVFVSQVYLPNIKIRKRSLQIDERIARQYLSPVFGHRPLSDINRCEVEDWLNGLLESGLAPSSCNRFLAVFKTICSFAETRGFLESGKSPCNGVSSFKVHTQRERYLSQDEARRLMDRLEQSDRPEALALRLLLLTGARKSEILKARWENVNLEQRLLTVPLSKSGKPRHIVLSDAAIAVIRAIPKKAGIPWLFPGHAEGKPLSDLYLFWKKLRGELGLNDVRIHDLRHTFASFLVNSGHSLYEVQKCLATQIHAPPCATRILARTPFWRLRKWLGEFYPAQRQTGKGKTICRRKGDTAQMPRGQPRRRGWCEVSLSDGVKSWIKTDE